MAEIAPFTFEAVAKRRATGIGIANVTETPAERAARERSSLAKRTRATVGDGRRGLQHRTFEVNQAQLNNL